MSWIATTEGVAGAAVRMAVPLIFAAQGELLAERAGVLNIGLEGLMLCGAFTGAAVAAAAGSPWIGLAAGMSVGALLAAAFGLLVVLRGADQVVAGIALNLLALGLTGVLYHAAASASGVSGSLAAPTFHDFPLAGLAAIPLVGRAFFERNVLCYLAYALTPAVAFFLYHTRAGLRWRATGEHPLAAETAGANVARVRMAAVTACGALAAAGGVYLSIGHLDRFGENMVAGRGFIALAIVILGRWNPWGALAAGLFFGLAQGLQLALGARGTGLPYQFLLALPYVATIAALLLRFGRVRPPARLAEPYRRA